MEREFLPYTWIGFSGKWPHDRQINHPQNFLLHNPLLSLSQYPTSPLLSLSWAPWQVLAQAPFLP